jgi:hypothetical protein
MAKKGGVWQKSDKLWQKNEKLWEKKMIHKGSMVIHTSIILCDSSTDDCENFFMLCFQLVVLHLALLPNSALPITSELYYYSDPGPQS